VKLADFGLLTDENIDEQIVSFLRSQGFRVKDVKEENLVGSDDVTLLRLAMAENRVVVTHDSDFGTRAIAAGEPSVGLLYLRPGHFKPEFTIDTMRILLAEDLDLTPPFIVVAVRSGGNVKIRIRQ
jgi:predicted nuclease of predicted toxin-antitoxin system